MIDLDDTPTTMPAPNSDLVAMLGLGGNSIAPTAASVAKQKSAIDDILGLFNNTPTSVQSVGSPPSQPQPQPAYASLFDTASSSSLLSSSPAAASPLAPRTTLYTAYEKNGLKITLTPQVSAMRPGLVNILARFQNLGSTPITSLNFQAAVPKVAHPHRSFYNVAQCFQTQQLQMLPMSSPSINPGASETQQMRVMSPVGVRSLLFSCVYSRRSPIVGSRSATIANITHGERKYDSRSSRFLGFPTKPNIRSMTIPIPCTELEG